MNKIFALLLIVVFLFSCKKDDDKNTKPVYYNLEGAMAQSSNACIESSDGNLIFCGYNTDSLHISKATKKGALLWTKEYYIGGNSEINAIAEDNNHNLFICGTIPGNSGTNVLLIKATASGDTLWKKTYDNNGSFNNENGKCIIKTQDGNLLIGAASQSSNYLLDYDYYLLKVNQEGNEIWSEVYEDNEVQLPNHIMETQNGDILVTGWGYSSQLPGSMGLLRTNSTGIKLWSRAVSMFYLLSGTYAQELPDGSLIVCGSNSYDEDAQIVLLKLDNTGNTIWQKSYGNIANLDVPISFVINNDNTYTLVGFTSQYTQNDRADGVLLTINSEGENTEFTYFASPTNIRPLKIFKESNGNNLIVGVRLNTTQQNGIFITQTNSSGNFIP